MRIFAIPFTYVLMVASGFACCNVDDSTKSLLQIAEEELKTTFDDKDHIQRFLKNVERGNATVFEEKERDKQLIPSELVQFICSNPLALEKVTTNGIYLRNAIFEERLYLRTIDVNFPLRLIGCRFDDGFNFSRSTFEELDLRNSWVVGNADLQFSSFDRLNLSNGQFRHESKSVDKDVVDCAGMTGDFVTMVGSEFQGRLNLTAVKIDLGIRLDGCKFSDTEHAIYAERVDIGHGVWMRGLKADQQSIYLSGRIGGLYMDSFGSDSSTAGEHTSIRDLYCRDLQVESCVCLSDGFKAIGEVYLYGVSIGDQLTCTNSEFSTFWGENSIGMTNGIDFSGSIIRSYFNLDNVKVSAGLRMSNGFISDGPVHIRGASIGTKLECNSATFQDFDANSVSGMSAGIDFSNCIFEGSLNFRNAVIRAGIKFEDVLFNTADEGTKEDFVAIDLQGVQVKDSIRIFGSCGSIINGQLQLTKALIGQSVLIENCEIDPRNIEVPNQLDVLKAENLIVDRDFVLRDVAIDGEVDLAGSKIRGALALQNINSASSSTECEYSLDLEFANIYHLKDETHCWPTGELKLSGIKLDRIPNDNKESEKNFRERIEWLNRQDKNSASSLDAFDSIAQTYKDNGQNEKSIKLLIAKEEFVNRMASTPEWRKKYGYLMGFIGYGYRPFNCIWPMSIVILFGTFVFYLGDKRGLFSATKDKFKNSIFVELPSTNSQSERRVDGDVQLVEYSADLRSVDSYAYMATGSQTFRVLSNLKLPISEKLPPGYPRLQPLVYSIDSFVPFINFRQVEFWLPCSSQEHFFPHAKMRTRLQNWFTWGGALKLYFWIHTLAGWTLTTLFVVGLTRIVR